MDPHGFPAAARQVAGGGVSVSSAPTSLPDSATAPATIKPAYASHDPGHCAPDAATADRTDHTPASSTQPAHASTSSVAYSALRPLVTAGLTGPSGTSLLQQTAAAHAATSASTTSPPASSSTPSTTSASSSQRHYSAQPSPVSMSSWSPTNRLGRTPLTMPSPASARSPRALAAAPTPRGGTAFFVDLTSPVSVRPLSVLVPPLPPRTTTVDAHDDDDPDAPTTTDHLHKMNARMLQATLNRSAFLYERRLKIKHRADLIKRKVLLQRHRDRLVALKRKTKAEIAQSVADLNRHRLMQARAEQFGALVERAQHVAITKRLERCVTMRRSFTTTFADLVIDTNLSLDAYLEADDEAAEQEERHEMGGGGGADSGEPQSHFSHAVGTTAARFGTTTTNAEARERSPTWSEPQFGTHPAGFDAQPMAGTDPAPALGMALHTSNMRSPSKALTPPPPAPHTAMPALHHTWSVPLTGGSSPSSQPLADLDAYLPPVTRYTLRELEVTEILANVQLRHDLVFDGDMQFRPNVDGDRGSVRAAKTAAYWAEIGDELAQASAGTRAWFRVPLLLLELKEIVRELVPPSAEFETMLNEHMDIEWITQQLQKKTGVAVVGVVRWLADQLHQYCAPCRDTLIETMVDQFKTEQYVVGFRTCLEVLEFMKLDFANHHLKKLRPWIVENAAEFEWKYFKERFESKLVTVHTTRAWFEAALERLPSEKPATVLNEALVSLIADHDAMQPATPTALPETLRMDTARLTAYHNDFQDISIMAALLMLFRQACSGKARPSDVAATKQTLWTLLNDADTTMDHVTAQLMHDAGQVRGLVLGDTERHLLAQMVDKTLALDNPVFALVQQRVARVLVAYLAAGGVVPPPAELARAGLAECVVEVEDLAKKVKVLADHHRATYAPLYDAMCQSWHALRRTGATVG
ncbi:hypothetical protein AMAG_09169 [Allomyces macrogynus ATCC 38327]|uniref:Uncharacterized protein n=1 Tax=Allomyces macrogynus (strain ATCC 38327) TaxID=578462 RepID=A0A0L0SNN5_ALLM3|nr:hypothetical protein AMAG_09169 [Allomyces macrogynus ATCC 38327]|eukprot:KNE64107.1 hypothetical protein AMAG_09169 [Allomyces macrogynus ATCC 38327]